VKSFLLAALLLASPAPSQILDTPEHFSAKDTTVQHPATLPDAALQQLLKDETVRHALPKSKPIPAKWLLVSQLHLAESAEEDYLAIGRGPLGGANVATFWIFHQHGKTFDLILTVSAHDLMLRPNSSHGLRDLEAVTIAPGNVTIADYAFDGARYQAHRAKTEKVR
jgi:hypothetical protein